jgi:tetratricopeptide (TPR) repeat protein
MAFVLSAPMAQCLAQFDPAVERQLLESLFVQGRYKQALEEARRVEAVIRPRKGSRPAPPSSDLIELILYRGSIEQRMGNLDDAADLLGEASKLFWGKDFQRTIQVQAARLGDAEQVRQFQRVANELAMRLLDNETELRLERLRAANHAFEVRVNPAPDPDGVDKMIQEIDELVRRSLAVRRQNAGMGTAEAAISPYHRMMFSEARPLRYAGMRYLEASRLPWTTPADLLEDDAGTAGRASEDNSQPAAVRTPVSATGAAPDPNRPRMAESQRRRAIGYLQRAAGLYETAAAEPRADKTEADGDASADDGDDDRDDDRADRRAGGPDPAPTEVLSMEMALMRAEPLIPLAEALMFDRRFDDARTHIDECMRLIRDGVAETHPMLGLPTIISARNSLEQASAEFEKGAVSQARQHARKAADALAFAKELIESPESQYDPASPLHALLADLGKAASDQDTRATREAAARDAADAAARRALQALSRGSARRAPPAAAVVPAPPAADAAETPPASEESASE